MKQKIKSFVERWKKYHPKTKCECAISNLLFENVKGQDHAKQLFKDKVLEIDLNVEQFIMLSQVLDTTPAAFTENGMRDFLSDKKYHYLKNILFVGVVNSTFDRRDFQTILDLFDDLGIDPESLGEIVEQI